MLYFLTRLHKTVFFFTPLGNKNIFSLELVKKKKHSFKFLIKHKLVKLLVPFYTTLGYNSHFRYTKLKRGKKDNCSIAKFPFLLSPLHSPRSAETDEERPIQFIDKPPMNKHFPLSIKSTDDSLQAEHKDRRKRQRRA